MKRTTILILVLCMVLSFACKATAEGMSLKGYGYIDRDGNMVIDPQFDYAYSFSSGRARVFAGTLSSSGYPDEGRYGFIDTNGKEVIPVIYDAATEFSKQGTACVCKNGQYGVIDTQGNPVIEFKYDHVSYNESTNTYFGFHGEMSTYGYPQKGTYQILDEKGQELFSISGDAVYGYEGYYEVKRNEKYALIALDGTALTEYQYATLGSETKDSLSYQINDQYGYIDNKGNVLIEKSYDSAGPFVDGKAIVEKDGKYMLIDQSGTVLVTYQADYVDITITNGRYTRAFEGSLSKYGSPENGKYYLMNIDGTYVSRGYKKEDSYFLDSGGTWRVKENGHWYILNMEGTEITSVECDYIYLCGEDRLVLKKNEQYALADLQGKLITEYLFDNIRITSEELIPVYFAGKEPDFRSVRWGMTEAEVKAVEGSVVDYSGKLDGRNAKYIGYDSSLMGNKVILAFYFGPDGLYEARYLWAESHSNESLFISDYESVKAQLTKKYGAPLWDHETWDTDSHKRNYSDDKGRGLSYGYLSYETFYSTPRTYISMQMSADNFDVSFSIFYESKNVSAPVADYSDQF